MRPMETHHGIEFMCCDLDDLDRYCHHVAGNVGIMATELFMHRFGDSEFAATDEWREDGRRMGLGLQITNIIKDCHTDAERGVSYIPSRYVDITRPEYRLIPSGKADLIKHAIKYLDSAMQYVQAVPYTEDGIRQFLLGSILPAIATMELASTGADRNPKISRAQMVDIFDCIEKHTGDNRIHVTWYEEHRQRTLKNLQ